MLNDTTVSYKILYKTYNPVIQIINYKEKGGGETLRQTHGSYLDPDSQTPKRNF